jgi:Tfp pilus assembly protein PilV
MTRLGNGARRGFTLIEVVVALVVLEVAVIGLVGTLALATATLTRAETLERAVATAEGVLDSIARGASAGADSLVSSAARVTWTVDDSGRVQLRARDAADRVLFELEAVLEP